MIMTIGEVAAKTGLQTSAIRFYEKAGLLTPPFRKSGRRIYQTEVLHQLNIISVFKELGFSLEEVGLLLNELPKEKAASPRWLSLAQAKVQEMENIIVRATAVKRTLVDIMRCRCTKLEDCAKGFSRNPGRREKLQLPGPAGVLSGAKASKGHTGVSRVSSR
jgi:MerR family redox-sensitive transcriptional activator SoxR